MVSISVGCYHVLALTADGAVKSWGYNGFGQLGNDSLIDSNVPVDVLQLSAAAAVPALAGPHRCVHGQRGARHGLRRRRQPHRHPAWQRRCPREGGRPQRDLGPGGRDVRQIALSGKRIGVLKGSGEARVKEGGLSATWVLEADNVIELALS
ncbi:hypothetical protein [Streptomyces atratus]